MREDEPTVDNINGRSRGGTSASYLAKHGTNQHEEGGVDIIKSSPLQGGTSASYLARRILRDDPDVFAKLEAGEFPSVRQAAIAAGIITPPTPLEAAKKAYEKLDDESRRAFHEWLGKDR